MSGKTFYLTTTLPYVNADPHIGFALEIVQADAIARLKRQEGFDVIFNFGTDEHGLKIYRKAKESKKDPQEYVDEFAAKFNDLKKALNLSYTNFIRTTDPKHKKAAQKFWELCKENGYIYKKMYKIKYCVGCELEKTDSELEDGRCPIHPTQEIEQIEEENYFFKFSEFQKPLLELYENQRDFVVPEFRHKEIKHFVEAGIQDFSISRLKEKLPWGVPVPDDDEHVMYVWFDALINYISTLGWPENSANYLEYWPGIQFAGKDNLRQQSAIWQAMLLAAGLPTSKQIIIHGFITIDGQKISKSVGNVVNPYELVDRYGTDALRYYLLAKVHPFEDSDFTYEKFTTIYNADLANGLGNLVSRVAKLCQNNELSFHESNEKNTSFIKEVQKKASSYVFHEALELIWKKIAELDKYLTVQKPWEKDKNEASRDLQIIVTSDESITGIFEIAEALKPFLPDTSEKIMLQFNNSKITTGKPLFPRIQ